MFFGCATGTDFYLNKEPMRQIVTISQGGKSLTLEAKSLIQDNVIRVRLVSEFYRGNAEIVFDNGEYHMTYSSLPIDKKKTEYLKGDLYAAFFAGDYPFKSDYKMFGESVIENNVKSVRDTDGYELYRVLYNGKEIRIRNIVRDYDILINSDIPIQ